jgi:polar amino acid transport system permease protein
LIELSAIPPLIPAVLRGVPLTLAITVTAFVLGTLLALPLAVIRIDRTRWLSPIVGIWVEFFLITPPLVHVLWVYYVLPIAFGIRLSDLTSVILALTASTSAQMTEVLRAALQSIPPTQREAGVVLGLSPFQRFRYVIFPQAKRLFMAPATSTVASLMKETAIAAVIGVPELLNRGQVVAIETYRSLEAFTLVALIYFILIYPFVLAGSVLERRSRAGFGRA